MILALANAIADPVKMHVNSLGALLLDSVLIGNMRCGDVVHLNGYWGLQIAQFDEYLEGAGFFAIVEEGGKFGFGGIAWRRLCTRFGTGH